MTYRENLERAITAYHHAKEAASAARDYDAVATLRAVIEATKDKLRAISPSAASVTADYPDADGTDAAHPAWWRGHDHAVGILCQHANAILDGNASPNGVASEPWETTRRRLFSMVQAMERVKSIGGNVEPLLGTLP